MRAAAPPARWGKVTEVTTMPEDVAEPASAIAPPRMTNCHRLISIFGALPIPSPSPSTSELEHQAGGDSPSHLVARALVEGQDVADADAGLKWSDRLEVEAGADGREEAIGSGVGAGQAALAVQFNDRNGTQDARQ